MKKSFTVFLAKVNPLSINIIERLYKTLAEDRYSDEKGFGFNKLSENNGYLAASLVKRTPTFVQHFDLQTNQLVEREIFLFSEIKFGVDPLHELLEIYGNVKEASKVRAVLKNYFPHQTRVQTNMSNSV